MLTIETVAWTVTVNYFIDVFYYLCPSNVYTEINKCTDYSFFRYVISFSLQPYICNEKAF